MNVALRESPVLFARERIVEVFGEITPLLQAHWEEIAHYPDIPLNPDYDRYVQAERNDQLRIFTVRLESKLIGYAIYGVNVGMHYRTCLIALQDILFVLPSHRRGRIALRLIEYADRQLQGEGVQVVIQHVKSSHPALARLLELQKYELMDHIYTKRLDRGI
jgi:GNAT superfamily N-acetyltransferase